LGYRGELIRQFFLEYNECLSNDFTLSDGGKTIELENSDIDDWRITFVDTGLHSNIGERLLAVRKYVESEPVFLANYSDGLTDLSLDKIIDTFHNNNATACFAAVQTPQSFHAIQASQEGLVRSIGPVNESGLWINGGFFVLSNEIFNYLMPGEELVEEPFNRLIAKSKLSAVKYRGFWQSMDNLKDKIGFDRMYARGRAPWELWNEGP
jgi:glucose-1-phosphate cytidylyltransferase